MLNILLKQKYRKINILKKKLKKLFLKKKNENPKPILNNFIGLIVRCKDEPYVSEFVNYYIKQGIDKIHILDDNSNKVIYKDVINNEKVSIIYDNNIIKKKSINKLYMKIKNNFEWIIYVDMDEYITTKKNINKTIKEELETTFKNCMCIKIPWVMMSCNSMQNNPESLLKTNIYRWNHDNKHISKEHKFRCRYEKIEVKCIFKPKFFNDIFYHNPINPKKRVKIVESIKNTKQKLNSFYNKLREKDIAEGYLLCYHYRIVSVENCLNKIKNKLMYKKYKLEDLLSTDYPEIIDETLKNKSDLLSTDYPEIIDETTLQNKLDLLSTDYPEIIDETLKNKSDLLSTDYPEIIDETTLQNKLDLLSTDYPEIIDETLKNKSDLLSTDYPETTNL